MMTASPSTILLVEDDLGQAELIRLNLQLGNVRQEIVHVTDAIQALDYVHRRGLFEDRGDGAVLILLDLHLPRVHGIDFLREVKSAQSTRQTPVLIFAAEDNPETVLLCYQLGCNLFLSKPLAFEDFIGTIERLAGVIQSVSLPGEL